MTLIRWCSFRVGAKTSAGQHEVVPAALGAWLIFISVLAASCGGRASVTSTPDAAAPDGGSSRDSGPSSDAGCDAQTCPSGCCNSAGVCLAGTDITACGALGQTCANCQAAGHNLCDATLHACGDNVGAQCDPANCKGCCSGSQCLVGTNLNACGQSGAACTDCATAGQTCVASSGPLPGGACQAAKTCDPQSCPNGCCDTAGMCRRGMSDPHCGAGGAACQDCTATGETCMSQTCVAPPPPCPNGCTTCCDTAGNCLPGTMDSQCGSSGMQCQDCTTSSQVCNFGSCSPPMACPATYPGCMTGSVTIVTPQAACSASELQMAATACATGFSSSPACQNFFSQLNNQDQNCAFCLSSFTFDFNQPDGIFACATPFVTAACAQQAACYQDCVDSVCSGCGSTNLSSCLMQSGPAACPTFASGNACITAVLSGAAAMCNPATYSGSFGAWLAAVGAAYCTIQD